MTPPSDPITITLDKPRSLRYSFRALRQLEKDTGRKLLAGELLKLQSLDDVAQFLLAGLQHEDRTLTLDQVADMIVLAELKTYLDAVGKALVEALPKRGANDIPLPTSQVQ